MDSTEDADRIVHERWKRGEDQSAAKRAQDAFDIEMRRIRQDLTHGVNEETRKKALFGSEMKQRELQYWLNQETLSEQQWRRKYRERYGRNPERNETVGDFLFKLSEDTGLLNLIGEVGSDTTGFVSDIIKGFSSDKSPDDVPNFFGNPLFVPQLIRRSARKRMRDRNSQK